MCLKDSTLDAKCSTTNFCLHEIDGVKTLKRNHQYYYQVQAQLHITEASYCDFVVWQPNAIMQKERIYPDSVFFDEAMTKVTNFLQMCIIPEVVGKLYTAPRSTPAAVFSSTDGIGCYCGEPDEGEMFVCKSGICERGRFHQKCLRFNKVSKTWKCFDCSRIIAKEKRQKQKAAKQK